jgi:hypothetical protein
MKVQKPTAEQLIARAEIFDALMRYASGCDRHDPDLIRSAYHPDAHHYHGDVDGDVEDLIDWINSPTGGMHHTIKVGGAEVERIPGVLHFIGNINYEFASDDLALVHSYCLTLQVTRKEDGSEDFMNIGLRYVDRFEKRDGEWKIAKRVVPVDYATLPVPYGDAGLNNNAVPSRRDRSDEYWKMRAEIGLE